MDDRSTTSRADLDVHFEASQVSRPMAVAG